MVKANFMFCYSAKASLTLTFFQFNLFSKLNKLWDVFFIPSEVLLRLNLKHNVLHLKAFYL